MTTETRLQDILIAAHQAWSDLLGGQLHYEGNIIHPDLDFWARFPNKQNPGYPCTVCVSGAYYFAKTGNLLSLNKVGSIEVFIDTLRSGRNSVLSLLSSLPNPRYQQIEPLLREVLAIWPDDSIFDNLVPPTDTTNAKILKLLSLLISNLEPSNL
jgi:hypothetical protein